MPTVHLQRELFRLFRQISTQVSFSEMTRPVTLGKVVSKDSAEIQQACSTLTGGGVIAIPTDTVYGVAGLAQSVKAIERLYSIKKRDVSKPIAICVAEIEDIYRWAKVTVDNSLLVELLPGAVTLIFERTAELNKNLNPETNLVGVRIPDSSFVRALCQCLRNPLALTSANISSQSSTLQVSEFSELWPLLDMIVDGGALCQGEEEVQRQGSTVVDLSVGGTFKLIRAGCCLKSTRETLLNYGLTEVTPAV